MTTTDLIIIGSGPGGYRAADYAAKNGLQVIIFEALEAGGTCLNCGCIPTKCLAHDASKEEKPAFEQVMARKDVYKRQVHGRCHRCQPSHLHRLGEPWHIGIHGQSGVFGNSTSIGVREQDADAAVAVLNDEFAKEIETGAMFPMEAQSGLATIAIVGENMRHLDVYKRQVYRLPLNAC